MATTYGSARWMREVLHRRSRVSFRSRTAPRSRAQHPPPTSSVRMRSPWCDSVCVLPTIHASKTRSRSSMRCSESKRPMARAGTDTTATVTGNTRTARRLMEPGLVGFGRCSPGKGATTSWRLDARKPPRSCCEPWRSLPMRAACSRNRCGTPPTSRSGTSTGEDRPDRRCPSSGLTPNTSSYGGHSPTAMSLICRRR